MAEYKKVNMNTGDSTLWSPATVGDELEGMYVDKKTGVGSNNSNIYTIQKENGEFAAFWGSAVIDSNFLKIPLGAQVKLVYKGKTKNVKGNREFKNFDIYSKEVKAPEEQTDSSEEVNPDDVPF